MNGFVVTVPAPGAAETKITSSPFWPDVEPTSIREAHRIDGTVTAPRLREALIEAIASVNEELDAWRAARVLEGRATLADVPAPVISDVSVHVHRYQRAVGCMAKAMLIERYRDFDTTAAGHQNGDQLENPIDDLRRDARWAISAILGISRTTVELI